MDDARRRTSYVNVAGHPVHALSVSLPIGLYITSAATALVSLLRPRDRFWSRTSHLSGAAAAGSSATVALAGLVDYLTLVHEPRAKKVGLAHMAANSAALVVQLLTLRLDRTDRGKRAILEGLVLGLVSLAGFLGGELVYRHRIGVFGNDR